MQAIENIRTVSTQLTPIHADLCQISLKAKCFNRAIKYLNADITEIATTEVSFFSKLFNKVVFDTTTVFYRIYNTTSS